MLPLTYVGEPKLLAQDLLEAGAPASSAACSGVMPSATISDAIVSGRKGGVCRGYNRAHYIGAGGAMQSWADHLVHCEPAQVILLRD
jgi:hypothetical protein